jgi:glycosyltransferase involved in cell wall biosynthesis
LILDSQLISIVIPTFNRANLICKAIDSVLRETIPGDEVIVVDSGSIDDTASVVAKYGDRVRYIYLTERGAGLARNRGVQEAKNPLVTFLDSDDEWMPGHNYILRSFMAARPDLLFCFANYTARFPDGSTRPFAHQSHFGWELNWEEIMGPARPISTYIKLPEGAEDFLCYEDHNLYRSLCCYSYVHVNSLMVRRKEAGDSFHFAEDLPTAEEWECAGLLARAGKSAYLHKDLSWLNHHGGPRLINAKMFEYSSARITLMKRVWGADANFQKQHGQLYARELKNIQLLKIRELIALGRTAEARIELRDTASSPLLYRVLAAMPEALVGAIMKARRLLLFKSR